MLLKTEPVSGMWAVPGIMGKRRCGVSGKENVLWKIDTSMDCVPNRTQNGRNQDLHPWKGYKRYLQFTRRHPCG